MKHFLEVIGVLIALAALVVGLLAWLSPFSPVESSPFAQKASDAGASSTPAVIVITATAPQPLQLPTTVQQPTPMVIVVTATPLPMPSSVIPSATSAPINTNDQRDRAAQTLGYRNLDAFMVAFGIPAEVKPRIFVCPNEETWCLGAYEGSGADFHFRNILLCQLDGKQANGTSNIPVGFDGMVRGFTVRPCKGK